MKTQTYEEAVLKTVMWWTEKSFRTPLNQNNGDNSSAGTMTHMLMNMVASKAQEEITDEKIKKFESKLTELLMKAERHERALHVDYHPCSFLFESAKFAGIDSHCFPCKSRTHIDENNRVHAKYQYGNSSVEI